MADGSSGILETCSPGAKRAAAVLLGLGPDVASTIFKQLTEKEMRQVALGSRALRRTPPEVVPETLRAFVSAMEKVGTEALAGDDALRAIAEKSVGAEMAGRAFDGVAPKPKSSEDLLGGIAVADPEALAMVLRREHPQTVALVLSALPPDRAADVMTHLGDSQRAQIVRRMATVESVTPDVLLEVQQALTGELATLSSGGLRKVDGRAVALEVLRRTPTAQQAEVLEAIEKADATLAADLKTKLFTFGDLALLTDRDIQTLAKELDMSQLTMALKGASPEVKEKFLKNMSSRAAQLLEDDLAAMGPVRVSAVEAAQAEIAKLTAQLGSQGRITLVSPTDKML